MLFLWLNLRQPVMVGRYIKGSYARVRRSFISSRGWVVLAKEISKKELRLSQTMRIFKGDLTYQKKFSQAIRKKNTNSVIS